MSKVRISSGQVLAVLVNMIFGKAIGFSTHAMARTVGSDMWLAMLIALLTGLPVITAAVWVAGGASRQSLADHLERLAGTWLGRLIMLLLAFFFLAAYCTSALTTILHISDYLMTETPIQIFILLYALLCLYGTYLGIEVIARLAVPGLLMIVVLDSLVVAGTFDHFDYSRLLPVLDYGVGPVLQASMVGATDVAMATASALLLFPMADQPKRWYRAAWGALALSVPLVGMWPLFEVAVLSHEVIAQYLIACMQLARAAELSIWLHRYELVMVFFFVYTVLTQSLVLLYGASYMLEGALPFLRWSRLTRLALLTVITMPVQYFLGSDRDLYGLFLIHAWPVISLPLGYGLPVLLAALGMLRRLLPGNSMPARSG